MKRLAGLMVLSAVLFPSTALAEETVTVLGLRSATADEQVAAQMTNALRQAASASTTITYSGRENQLSQLLVLFDCDDATPRCMREIGRNLNSTRLVYGLIEPESGRSDADYAVTLRYFNVDSGQIERDLRELVPRGTNAQGMAERARRFFNALTGTVTTGELSISCNISGAQVLVDDRDVGTTGDDPLVVQDLDAGNVDVEIRSDGYIAYHQSVSIEAGQTRRLSVELHAEGGGGGGTSETVGQGGSGQEHGPDWVEPQPQPRRRSLAWLGWTNIGLAAVFGGLGLWSSLHVNNVRNDHRLAENYSSQGDICEGSVIDRSADGVGYSVSEADDICGTARTLQALQFAFYGLSAVTFGIGLWLVLREMNRGEDADALRLHVTPVALRDGGALSASLRF